MNRKKVVAICGSTRLNSVNHSLLKALGDLSAESLEITLSQSIEHLPQFNPDKDDENVHETVSVFRKQLDESEGVIICTPEYAHGVPGSLKNAIDWTVATSQFMQKPTMLITASTDGKYGHKALLETLKVVDTLTTDKLQLVVDFAKTKISADGKITDAKTLASVKEMIEAFVQTIDDRKFTSEE